MWPPSDESKPENNLAWNIIDLIMLHWLYSTYPRNTLFMLWINVLHDMLMYNYVPCLVLALFFAFHLNSSNLKKKSKLPPESSDLLRNIAKTIIDMHAWALTGNVKSNLLWQLQLSWGAFNFASWIKIETWLACGIRTCVAFHLFPIACSL